MANSGMNMSEEEVMVLWLAHSALVQVTQVLLRVCDLFCAFYLSNNAMLNKKGSTL